MPIYEYECAKCGARVERLIRNPADVPKACPSCGAKPLRKALSAFSVGAAVAGHPGHEPSAACASCPSGSCPYSGGM
jgi:putative FmdB family regulatory protein